MGTKMSLSPTVEGVLTVRNQSNLESISRNGEVSSLYWNSQNGSLQMGPFPYVVLVHGYRTSYKEARLAYAQFRGWLAEWEVRARILEFHWPGDHRTGFSWACYSPENAKACGELLAKWIMKENHSDRARIVLVGHSLGCRLILEALRVLPLGYQKRTSGCLMAAAVPMQAVQNGHLGPAREEKDRWKVLYSRSDGILENWFPLGQWFRRDYPGSPAIGYTGRPKKKWAVREMSGYGHSGYWAGGKKSQQNTLWGKRATLDRHPLDPIKPLSGNNGESVKTVAKLLGKIFPREITLRMGPASHPEVPKRVPHSRSMN
jgi:hypothetical protein